MCLIVIKAFKDIQAVPETHALCTHDLNGMNIELSLDKLLLHRPYTTSVTVMHVLKYCPPCL